MASALGLAALKIGLLVALLRVVGGRVIPWMLERVAATRSRELFTLAVLVVALGIAVGSAKVFGVSMALGAFLAGMVVGRSEFSLRAASEALPMRDAFAVLFFVSVGMLFDPHAPRGSPGSMAATLAIVLLGKPLAALAISSCCGYPLRVALPVAVSLAQIGEFSFMLAAVGPQLGVMPDRAVNALVAAAIVVDHPQPAALPRRAGPMEPGSRAAVPASRRGARDDADAPMSTPPSGHRRRLRAGGADGDAAAARQRDRADRDRAQSRHRAPAAGVRRAGRLRRCQPPRDPRRGGDRPGSPPGPHGRGTGAADEEIMRRARELNPEIRVVARTQYMHEVPGAAQGRGGRTCFPARARWPWR